MAKIPTEFDPRRLPDIIRRPLGKRAQIKRAIVTLAEGSKIDLFPDV